MADSENLVRLSDNTVVFFDTIPLKNSEWTEDIATLIKQGQSLTLTEDETLELLNELMKRHGE